MILCKLDDADDYDVTDDGADNDADYYDAGVHNNNANGEYDDDR